MNMKYVFFWWFIVGVAIAGAPFANDGREGIRAVQCVPSYVILRWQSLIRGEDRIAKEHLYQSLLFFSLGFEDNLCNFLSYGQPITGNDEVMDESATWWVPKSVRSGELAFLDEMKISSFKPESLRDFGWSLQKSIDLSMTESGDWWVVLGKDVKRSNVIVQVLQHLNDDWGQARVKTKNRLKCDAYVSPSEQGPLRLMVVRLADQ